MKDLKVFCKGYYLTEAQATGKEKICGSLDLSSVTSIPEGFNPTVGGWLYLRGRVINTLVHQSPMFISGVTKNISKPTAYFKR